MNDLKNNTTQQSFHHKPGPYSYSRDKDRVGDCWCIHAAGADRPFASIPFGDSEDGSKGKELEATARLLAAAPQMLETLKLIEASMAAHMEACTPGFGDSELHWLVRAAVAIAETRPITNTDPALQELPDDETDFDRFVLPRRVEKALAAIDDYLWTEEKADYDATPKHLRNGHIWWALATIRSWRTRPRRQLTPK